MPSSYQAGRLEAFLEMRNRRLNNWHRQTCILNKEKEETEKQVNL